MKELELMQIVKNTVLDVLINEGLAGTTHIPIGVSNRHVHLSESAVERLFGKGYKLTKQKELSQPSQFACEETVTVIGPKGMIRNVRILGPARDITQLEVSLRDGFILGVTPPVRLSGDIDGTPGFTLQGPNGQLKLDKGLICAARHIHMHPQDAARFDVSNGEKVDIYVPGDRSITFHDTVIRVSENYQLEMHIDFDEANAAQIKHGQKGLLRR